jgi:hypothetical protein
MTKESVATELANHEAAAQTPVTQESAVHVASLKKPPAKRVATRKRVAKRLAAKVSLPKRAPKRRAAKPSNKKRIAKKPRAKKRAVAKPAPRPVAARKAIRKKSSGTRRGTIKRGRSEQVTTKAQAIRDTAKKLGKRFRPRDIISALAAKGITVSSPQVSMTLKAAGYRRIRRRSKPNPATAVSARQVVTFAVNDLVQTKKLADQLGGTARLKEVLTALERLL